MRSFFRTTPATPARTRLLEIDLFSSGELSIPRLSARGALILTAVALSLVLGLPASLSAQPAEAQPTDPLRFGQSVDVVGVTPIHGLGVDRNKIPTNVQTATASDLARQPGGHVGDLLTSSFTSVHVNEVQSNPFQPDIQFRGFTSSPLLGLPQGVAIYQNGVRMNEPFGDSVNWDAMPSTAIASINLLPGSNPLFGLNALGGAISLETKTGFSHPGHSVQLSAGSFGRAWADLSSGGQRNRLSYFVTGRVLGEGGWRDYSNTRIQQAFANVEWRTQTSTISASAMTGGNRMIGNGPAPVELLEEDRSAIFTHQDITRTRLGVFTLNASHRPSTRFEIDSVAYFRPMSARSFNGDDTNYGPCEEAAFANRLCADEGEGELVFDQFGRVIPLGDAPFSGTNNTSSTRTNGWGGSLQATYAGAVLGRENQFIVGGTLDAARVRYEADTEIARLTEDRGTIGIGLLDAEAAVRLRTSVRHLGAFVSDFFTVSPRLTVMAAARLNRSDITLYDQLGDDLNGDHGFTRLNPAVGATFALPRALTVYGNVATSSRVPTPSELSCADPEEPCRLPNAFISDPPLLQVVSRTMEGGVRGTTRGITWNASTFRTVNRDDIVFISSGALTNQGHFENVGDTLRRGLELSANGRVGERVQWSAAYTYLRATFESEMLLSSPNHPEEEDGEIEVEQGSDLPSIPRHNIKARLGASLGRAGLAATVLATSSQYFRGDEANLLDQVAGYAIVNLNGSFRLGPRLNLVGQVTNLFDRRYSTFGVLGEADDVLGDDFDDPRFVGPGAPRGAWFGVEWLLP